MKCEDIRRDIDAFVDGELEREAELAVRDHLSACGPCAREVEERRALSASLARAFDRSLEGVEPSPEDRRRAADRLAAAGGRTLFVARLAAVVAVGLAIGLIASVFVAPAPDPTVIAAQMKDVRVMDHQIRQLRDAAAGDLRFVRESLPDPGSPHPALRAANVYLWNVEDRLARPGGPPADVRRLVRETASEDFETQSRARAALRKLEAGAIDRLRAAAREESRHDRLFVSSLIADLEERSRSTGQVKVVVSRAAEGSQVTVTQFADGRVHVSLPGRMIRARNMGDLLRFHPQICRRYRISGTDGAVTVGESAGGVDLQGRLKLHFRTGAWDDASLGEAYRAWVSGHAGDAREIEKRWREFQDRFLRARRPVKLPRVEVDVEAILRDVKKWSGPELRNAGKELETRLKGLDARLHEARELRSWARGLRAYAEKLKKDK